MPIRFLDTSSITPTRKIRFLDEELEEEPPKITIPKRETAPEFNGTELRAMTPQIKAQFPIEQKISPIGKPEKPAFLGRAVRTLLRNTPIESIRRTQALMKAPELAPERYEELQSMKPVLEQLETPITAGLLVAGAEAPAATAKGLAKFLAVKEASQRGVLPLVKMAKQKVSGEPVKYEVTRLSEFLPDELRDIGDISEFILYGMGARKFSGLLKDPKVAAELAGARYRILKALGIKQETGLVPLTKEQLITAFGHKAARYSPEIYKEELAKRIIPETQKLHPFTGRPLYPEKATMPVSAPKPPQIKPTAPPVAPIAQPAGIVTPTILPKAEVPKFVGKPQGKVEYEYKPGEGTFQEQVDRARADMIAKAKGVIPTEGKVEGIESQYRGVHKAPTREFSDVYGALHEINKTYPDDIYTDPQAWRYYGHGTQKDMAMDKESIRIVRAVKGNPDAEITVYRSVPKGKQQTINEGDWVTINKQYAKMHGERFDEGQDIIEKKVKASEIFTEGNSIHEFGYSPEPKLSPTEGITVYRASKTLFDTKKIQGETFVTPDKTQAEKWGKIQGYQYLEKLNISKDAKVLKRVDIPEKFIKKEDGHVFISLDDQAKLIKYAREKGYDVVENFDYLPDGSIYEKEFIILNPKTLSKLSTPTAPVQPTSEGIIPAEGKLIEEAKKYKSAEEFVKAQGTPVYHGSPYGKIEPQDLIEQKGTGLVFVSKNKSFAENFAFTPPTKRIDYTDIGKEIKPDINEYIFRPKKMLDALDDGDLNELARIYKEHGNIRDLPGVDFDSSISDIAYALENEAFEGNWKWLEEQDFVKALKENNIDAVKFRNPSGFDEAGTPLKEDVFAILDKSAIKSKSQLTDIWNKANKGTDPLITEAKKYKSAEEFVKGQGTPLYSGGKTEVKEFTETGREMKLGGKRIGVFLTPDIGMAQIFAGRRDTSVSKEGITETYFTPKKPYQIQSEQNDLLIEAPQSHSQYIQELKDKGYDAIISSDKRQILVLDISQIKTKSQLTDIWNKANVPTEGKVMPAAPMAGGQVFKGQPMLKPGETIGDVKVIQTTSPADIKDISRKKLEFGPNDTIFTYPIVKEGKFTGKIFVKDGDKGIVSMPKDLSIEEAQKKLKEKILGHKPSATPEMVIGQPMAGGRYIPMHERPEWQEEQARLREEKLRQEIEEAGIEEELGRKKELKAYLTGKLKPGLTLQGEYANLKLLPWLFSKEKGFTPDELIGELRAMGFPVETDDDVIQLIDEYFKEEIGRGAGREEAAVSRKAQAKMKYRVEHPGRAPKISKPKRQETLVGKGTVLNMPDDTDKSKQLAITQDMPFTLLGNKAEVLSRLSTGLKKELTKDIEQVYDLFGGSKGYRVGLFSDIQNYHLNEFSDERYNYYKNLQNPASVEKMKIKVKELRNDLIGRIADAMDIPRNKYSPELLRKAINKWMSRGEADMRNKAILKIIQNFGNEQISQATSDKFRSPESSAIYYFLQNMSVYGLSKQGEEYTWSQGILRDKIKIRDNMRRIEEIDSQLSKEFSRDKNIVLTQEDAWKQMDKITADIKAGTIDPAKTAILVDPQYLNPTAKEGTYTVGQQDTTWEGHKKNLEQHLLPLIKTEAKIVYTNNEDMDLTNWLKANNLPFNVEISIGKVAKGAGRDEIISLINYELPEVYTGGKPIGAGGYEPGEITGESRYYAEYKAERARQEGDRLQRQTIIDKIKAFPKEKGISQASISRLKQYFNIRELKGAGMPELNKLISYLEKMQPGDKFVSEKQFAALYDIIKEIPDVAITPKRIIFDQLGEPGEPLSKGIVGKLSLEMFPTVDIKQESPYVKRTVDKVEIRISESEKEVSRRDEQLEKMLSKAEKARRRKLLLSEKARRAITPQNKEIFQALSGQKVDLTQEEVAVVAYLKNFFAKVKRELKLEKYRKHYVTHLEQPLMEKITTQGMIPAVSNIFNLRKKETIPIDILLELDNIIGSEKFFRFALQRKGGITPTTNIRRIVHAYSQIFETKKVLDEILPEGQALVKTLLQPKTAIWMKRYLQNLKGRGLDFNFRTGRMGWLANVADSIVDIGYLKLLGLNYWSAAKNLAAGEANSFIYQDLRNYLIGKKRMLSNPKKLFRMAKDNYILEGTYAEYTQKGIGRLKKVQHYMMIGQQAGEYEIRGSIFAGELTEEEWQTGEISPKRLQEIKDTIAITQGIFSKTQSPLWMQTWYGRMFMQMNRWRMTNAMMMRRLANGTREEFKRGKPGKNTKRFVKALMMYGIAMYLEFQLAKAGYKKAAKVAQSMGETVNNLIEIVTLKPIIDAIANNPTISVLKEIAFSIQALANYIGVPGAEEPRKIQFQRGIEKTWIAPIERTKELFTGQPASKSTTFKKPFKKTFKKPFKR